MAAPNPAPSDETSSILIRSNRLAVEIAAPGTVYNRTRFDWAGFVTQVTLDGRHTFCVPEDNNPKAGTGGIGLCSEFGIEKTIGYKEAKPGETFPKLGIGLLIRADQEPYNFFKPYEIAERFPIHFQARANEVRFIVDPVDCRGYAVRETKTLRVDDNCLEITCQMDNVGSQSIVTHEYCHNFVGIDGHELGPDYCLRFPYPVKLAKIHENYRKSLPPIIRTIMPGFMLEQMVKMAMRSDTFLVDGTDIRWQWTPKNSFYCRPMGFSLTEEPQWDLIHISSGVEMLEYDDFAPSRVAVWGAAHVVSAEIFVDINLQPGQSQSWTRRYEFFSGSQD